MNTSIKFHENLFISCLDISLKTYVNLMVSSQEHTHMQKFQHIYIS